MTVWTRLAPFEARMTRVSLPAELAREFRGAVGIERRHVEAPMEEMEGRPAAEGSCTHHDANDCCLATISARRWPIAVSTEEALA
jgi:hypothetical protein